MLTWIRNAWKAISAAIGVALTILTSVNAIPGLPDDVHLWVAVAIAVLTPIVTYFVPGPNRKAAT